MRRRISRCNPLSCKSWGFIFLSLLLSAIAPVRADALFAPLPQDAAPDNRAAALIAPGSLGQSPATNAALASLDPRLSPTIFLPVDAAYQFSAHIDGDFLVARFVIAPDYYLYRERFTHSQDKTRLDADYSPAVLKYDELFERETLLHFDQAELRIALAALRADTPVRIGYQGCAVAGLCYPPEVRLIDVDLHNRHVQVRSLAPPADTATDAPLATKDTAASASSAPTTDLTLVSAALMAFIGGLLLNLMPCVFPVLSIKALQLTQHSATTPQARRRLIAHGLTYSAGAVATFMLLAGILLAFKASGALLGWGFQFQSPAVIASLFFLFIALGLGLSGALNIGTGLMGAGDNLTRGSGLNASFFTGALAVIVASPCTAPVMGAAIGFALAQSSAVTLGVFAALGLGMALPLLLLCCFPRWQQLLPRPGKWMETFKELLAFPLYLSAIWLLWVYGRQTDMSGAAVLLCAALGLVFCVWLAAQFSSRAAQRLCALAALVLVIYSISATPAPGAKPTTSPWQTYSAAALAQHRSAGEPVLVNMTADWCITCLANEKAALDLPSTRAAFNQAGIITLKGDWTHSDPQITEFLREYGRSGVPLYVWFPANHSGPGIILPQILTQSLVFDYLKIENNDK